MSEKIKFLPIIPDTELHGFERGRGEEVLIHVFYKFEQISKTKVFIYIKFFLLFAGCLLYTSDAADDMQCVDLGGRRIIKKTNRD